MPDYRAWHSSRDAYHCAFRLLRLATVRDDIKIEVELARILDMYVLFPALLHRASMPSDVRTKFRELKIPRPVEMFIRLPGPAAVFQELRVFQNSAMAQLAARGIANASELKAGVLGLSEESIPKELRDRVVQRNIRDGGLSDFLVKHLGTIPLRGADNIYKRTGLPGRPVLS